MAGAAERLKQIAQQQFQTAAMQFVNGLDGQLDALKERVLTDMRALKAGEIELSQLVITDSDYEVMPKKPEIARKVG